MACCDEFNLVFLCVLSMLTLGFVEPQNNRPDVQPAASEADCICNASDAVCKCVFTIEYRLSMLLFDERLLVVPDYGFLKTSGKGGRRLTDDEARRVITTDGEGSRLVIAINGKFPGPRVDVYENQEIELTVINTFHTDSVTIHFHGIHQKGTPWMDGVSSVTQCPILPGQTFVYRFKAFPPGTHLYHAHIGDQRSMGLFGPFIVRKRDTEPLSEIIVSLQDFNHLMDAETAYLRMLSEQFNFETGEVIPTTFTLDGGKFSRFEFQSGLVNGKGRYWKTSYSHNGAPLERFKVEPGRVYRFRAIGAMTLYPMRIYIEGQTLSLLSSDGYNLKNQPVQSIIIHPGERYDFLVQFQESYDQSMYLLVAESLEVRSSYTGYHAAEAVIDVLKSGGKPDPNPPNNQRESCTPSSRCVIFNCPYGNAGNDAWICLNYNDVKNSDLYLDPTAVLGNKVDYEYFLNFGFPGFPNNTPGSVNGRAFMYPLPPVLTQPDDLKTKCDEQECLRNGICSCTYILEVPYNKIIQMVFTNIGNGSGWSHPVHMHGTSFFVMKMGLGTYNPKSGLLLQETTDIVCTDRYKFCSKAAWRNEKWSMGNLTGLNQQPPLKDTIVVPTGGYVVVRFISDNPGMWFLHCHIDLHNTNGMAMVVNVGPDRHPPPPNDFPQCKDFFYKRYLKTSGVLSDNPSANPGNRATASDVTLAGFFVGVAVIVGLLLIVGGLWWCIRKRRTNDDGEEIPIFSETRH